MSDQPRRGYAICSEPRSGTSYLGRLLTGSGRLGTPAEYFNPGSKAAATVPGYGPPLMVRTVLERGATPNGVYGVKVFSDHFDKPAAPWARTLPNLTFVHLERRDHLGQAVSWARANITRQFAADQTVLHEAVYDRAL